MRPREIIDKWIDLATENKMQEHRVMFWTIRDLVIGLKRTAGDRETAVEFLRTKCRDTPEREILLKDIEGRLS
jgi:hypothetical protein